ncbi:MAG: hypothetical protein ACKO23_03135 [Gemmataceae bacterium]
MFSLMLALALVPAQQQVVVPNVVLEDQFEAVRDVRHHRGDIVVLIYGDRKSADANKALGEQIHTAFHPGARGLPPAQARKAAVKPVEGGTELTRSPDVLAIPVALIGKVPPLIKKVIRGQFKSGSPEVPVWLDFTDTMKTTFPFTPGVPNVVVLDGQGRYRYAAAGAPTQEGMSKLLGTIEALRKEASAGK